MGSNLDVTVEVSGDGMGARLKIAGFTPEAWRARFAGTAAGEGAARLRAHLEAAGLFPACLRDDVLAWICETLAGAQAASDKAVEAAQAAEIAHGLSPVHEEPQGLAFHRSYLANAEAIADLRRKADTWGAAGIKEKLDPEYRVSAGEAVLSFHDALPGREGCDVFGAPVPFLPLRDRLPPFGKTLALRKNSLIAVCEGALVVEAGVLKVLGSDSLPTCQVAVSDDGMAAELVLAESPLNDWRVTMEMVRAALREQAVNCMLAEPEIQAALDRFNHDHLPQTLLVARGRAPVPGREGSVTLLVDPEPEAPEPGADGSIDFKDFSFFRKVSKGDRLAQVLPSQPGDPGMDVRGRPLPPPPLKEFNPEPGKNTAWSASEPGIVEAAAAGRLGIRHGMPEVVEVLDVSGDVSLKTGNIVFPGAVRVAGDVHGKMKIEAAGDVEVIGAVEDSIIKSDGAIVVRGGVNGMGGGLIKSRLSSVTVGYLHNQRIESHAGIIVYNEIISSQLLARTQISMRYGRYSVLGGHLLAGESLDLFNVGSEAGVKTMLEVGKDFEVEAELTEKKQRLRGHADDLEFLLDMEDQLGRILRLRRGPIDQDHLLQRRVQGAVEIVERWSDILKKEIDELSRRLYTAGTCEILVRGTAHAGTVIRYHDQTLVVPGTVEHRRWVFREKGPLPPPEGRSATV